MSPSTNSKRVCRIITNMGLSVRSTGVDQTLYMPGGLRHRLLPIRLQMGEAARKLIQQLLISGSGGIEGVPRAVVHHQIDPELERAECVRPECLNPDYPVPIHLSECDLRWGWGHTAHLRNFHSPGNSYPKN